MSPDRVVVGVDGSPPSIDALRRGAEIAAAGGAELEAITTWEFPAMFDAYYPPGSAPEVDAANILADAVARAFGDEPPLGLTQIVLQGRASRVLIEQSRNAYMLVLGNRGHGGFIGLLLGSVSAACAAHAHCPVLIMHTPERDSADGTGSTG